MSIQTQTVKTAAVPRLSSVGQALMAICLGAFLVGTAGFSPMGVLHNAAHDTRHSNAFPCH